MTTSDILISAAVFTLGPVLVAVCGLATIALAVYAHKETARIREDLIADDYDDEVIA